MAGFPVEVALIVRAVDQASQVIEKVGDNIGSFIEKNQKQLRAMGTVLTGLGAAVAATLGVMTKSALDEEVGINRLNIALQNAGASYAGLKDEIEASIAATQRKTNYGDEEQRDALTTLIGITGDYRGSLDQLQLATDLAAAKNMDLNSAATLVGKVATGNTELLSRYGITVREGASATEILADMQTRFGGAAEGAANPLTQLKNLIGDLGQDIGSFLVPALENFVGLLTPIIQGVRDFITNHQELAKQATIAAGAIGLVSTAIGITALFLSTSTGLFLINTGAIVARIIASIAAIAVENGLGMAMKATWAIMLANPIGLIITAIGLLAVAAFELITHWDAVKAFFSDLWDNIKIVFAEAVKFIVNYVLLPWVTEIEKIFAPIVKGIGKIVSIFNKDAGQAIMDFSNKLSNVKQSVNDWANGIEATARAHKTLNDAIEETDESVNKLTDDAYGAVDALKEVVELAPNSAGVAKYYGESGKQGRI